MFGYSLVCYDHSRKKGKLDSLHVLHRIACTVFILLAIYCLFMCILSILNAWQDISKYGTLGFSYPIQYYLKDNYFLEHVGLFLWITTELILYITLCHRTEQTRSTKGSVLYFYAMLIVHAAVWLHANFIQISEYSLPDVIDEAAIRYRVFINKTTIPSVVYFFLYLWRVRKLKSEKQS